MQQRMTAATWRNFLDDDGRRCSLHDVVSVLPATELQPGPVMDEHGPAVGLSDRLSGDGLRRPTAAASPEQ